MGWRDTCPAPFTRQRRGLPHDLAHCAFPGWAHPLFALLPLMGRAWVYVALPSSRMKSSAPLVGRPDRVTREAGLVGLIGKERGKEYWVMLYRIIYTAWPEVNVSLGARHARWQAAQPLSHSPKPDLAARADRAYRQPANMQSGTFCYHWLEEEEEDFA